MAENKIFAGPRVRRIRTKEGLTQAAMAEQLEISPSYLNLIERNQRPLTAQLVMKLVGRFKVDVEELQPSGEAGSVAALKEVFSDPLLSGELPGDTELMEITDGAPNAAIGIVKLYRAYREQQSRLSDLSRLMGEAGHQVDGAGTELAIDQVRNLIENTPWCFPALERAAERVRADLNRDHNRMTALSMLLRADHGLSVQTLPIETMPNWRRRYDRHSNRLFLSERLPVWERAELMAQELILLREKKVLDEEVELLQVKGDEVIRLIRMELARYAALAILMPYDRFLRTAARLEHDMILLANRFEVGFGQMAERLVAVRDNSAGHHAGLPFFMMQVDAAGNILRRLGSKGFPVARFGGQCPKLAIYSAFSNPGQTICERVIAPDGQVYLTICCTQKGPSVGAGEPVRRIATMLAIEDEMATQVLSNDTSAQRAGQGDDPLAAAIIHARSLADPRTAPPLKVGASCRLCERTDCIARSAPPLTRPLGLDDLVQGFGAFGLT